MVEPTESTESTESPESPGAKRRSRTTLIAVTAGVVVAGVLVAYGFSRSDDDRDSDTPPTIGVIQSPAQVVTTLGPSVPPGTVPITADLPLVPAGTADVAFPPVSSDIVVP